MEKWGSDLENIFRESLQEDETLEALAPKLAEVIQLLGPEEWEGLHHVFARMTFSNSWRVSLVVC